MKNFFIFFLLGLPFFLGAEKKHIEVEGRPDTCFENQNPEEKETYSQFLVQASPNHLFTHFLTSLSALNECIEIEDGSIWKISTYDQKRINSWRYYHVLTIAQNTSWFSSYQYRIINHSLNDSVEANLILGPFENEPNTHTIISIDLLRKQILLSNNTIWQVISSDASTFRKWQIQDTIIVGQNAGRSATTFPALLINVNMNNYTRAENL